MSTGSTGTTDPIGTTDPTTSTSTGSSTSEQTTGGGPELSCAYFCDVQGMKCAPDFAYPSLQACLDACVTWPVGTLADTTGDTLGCRLGYADKGESCINTTLSGGEQCVDDGDPTCGLYCATFLKNCVDFNPYADEADCLKQCSGWLPGMDGDPSGNTVGCRLGQAVNAMKYDNPGYHCPEASPDSVMCK